MNRQPKVSGCCGHPENDIYNAETGFCGDCGENTTFVVESEYRDEEQDARVNSMIASLAMGIVLAFGAAVLFAAPWLYAGAEFSGELR